MSRPFAHCGRTHSDYVRGLGTRFSGFYERYGERLDNLGQLGMVLYLPIQKLEKIFPSKSSDVNSPVISASAC